MREPRHAPQAQVGETAAPARAISPFRIIGAVLRGLLEGALPAIILVCILALFWEALTIVRVVTIPNGFALTQQLVTAISLGGLAISFIVFLVTGLRTLRNVRDRHLEGDYIESTVTMVTLATSLLIALITIWTTAGMPQTPAP